MVIFCGLLRWNCFKLMGSSTRTHAHRSAECLFIATDIAQFQQIFQFKWLFIFADYNSMNICVRLLNSTWIFTVEKFTYLTQFMKYLMRSSSEWLLLHKTNILDAGLQAGKRCHGIICCSFRKWRIIFQVFTLF